MNWIHNLTKSMEKSIEALEQEFSRIRTGRAHPSLLDGILVSAYEGEMALTQIASISVEGPRTLLISPWDKQLIIPIEKALRASPLNINPVTSDSVIRVPLAAPTEERRKELVRLLKEKAEHARIAIRNQRRDLLSELKEGLKEKLLTEDEEKRLQDQVQKTTDKFILHVDQLLKHKETEIMEV